MKERSIGFTAEMYQAVREGRKTQTRRVIKPQPQETEPHGIVNWYYPGDYPIGWGAYSYSEFPEWAAWKHSPYGIPGDHLYCKETYAMNKSSDKESYAERKVRWPNTGEPRFWYKADIQPNDPPLEPFAGRGRWRSSRFMPKAAARTWVEVTKVRVVRPMEISTEDIIAEGITTTLREHDAELDLMAQWTRLWDDINALRGYGTDVNPHCFAYSFRKIQAPEERA